MSLGTVLLLTEPKNPPRTGPPSARYERGRGNLLAEALMTEGWTPVMWWDHPVGPSVDDSPAVALVRSSAPLQIDRARALRAAGTPVLNDPDAQWAAGDKQHQADAFTAAGVPQPRTAAQLWGGQADPATPVVLKPRRGSSGDGVSLARLDHVASLGVDDLVVQEQVMGAEYRVVVVAGHCVGWAAKVLRPGEFRGNLAQGATMHEATCPSSEAGEIAVQSVNALGLAYGGVDLIMAATGPIVIEVNAATTLWGPTTASTTEIMGAMIEMIGAVSAARPR